MTSTTRITTASRSLAVGLAGLLLALPLTACGAVGTFAGGSAPLPVARIEALQGRTTAIRLDRDLLRDLDRLGVVPGALGSARLRGSRLALPVTGGNITIFEPGQVSPYVIGQVQHEGAGLSLTAGGTTVALRDLNVDPGASRVYGDVEVAGRRVASSAFLLALDGSTLEPLRTRERCVVLTGSGVLLSPAAARMLREAFGPSAPAAGTRVGTATLTLRTP